MLLPLVATCQLVLARIAQLAKSHDLLGNENVLGSLLLLCSMSKVRQIIGALGESCAVFFRKLTSVGWIVFASKNLEKFMHQRKERREKREERRRST
jgi:hypothetical protein